MCHNSNIEKRKYFINYYQILDERAVQSTYKAVPKDMAVFGTYLFQLNKYFTSKYFVFELINNGKSIMFASINRTDFGIYKYIHILNRWIYCV